MRTPWHDLISVLKDTLKTSLYFSCRLEQELLARIVGQLDQQSADPTLQEVADNVEVVDINGDEDQSSYNWIGMLFHFLIYVYVVQSVMWNRHEHKCKHM